MPADEAPNGVSNNVFYFDSDYINQVKIGSNTIENGIPLLKDLVHPNNDELTMSRSAASVNNSVIEKITLKIHKHNLRPALVGGAPINTSIKMHTVQNVITIEYPVLIVGNDWAEGKTNLSL